MQELKYNKELCIEYYLDKGKRKNSYIKIKDGKIFVNVPKYIDQKYIDNLLEEKMDWINKTLIKHKNSKQFIEYKNGAKIPLLGKNLVLNYIFTNNKKISIENDGNTLLIRIPQKYKILDEKEFSYLLKKIVDNFYKQIAIEEVMAAMDYLTIKTNLNPNKIYVKKLKSAWGLCSSKKYISINYKIVMFSRNAVEYVCLHELCHLKYMNHSKDFWNMVESYLPEYKKARKELKE